MHIFKSSRLFQIDQFESLNSDIQGLIFQIEMRPHSPLSRKSQKFQKFGTLHERFAYLETAYLS